MAISLAELRAYLAEMTKAAAAYEVEANAEAIAGKMWKRFTMDALLLFTPSGALEHIAATMAPPPIEDEFGYEDDDDDDLAARHQREQEALTGKEP